jgi:WD40 repeat protein/regulation of enolase protein 1 (concanavalin A-like superfamily)
VKKLWMSTDRPYGFYVTGGTLRSDAPSYVERSADRELFDGLMAGEFCYVLTSRQMGKSSLMVHTAARLQQHGVAVAVLDLTLLGQNLSPEQWYGGLLARLGQQLDLENELDAFWLANQQLSPLQRWMAALEEVVLGSGAQASGCPSLVLFIDEIDVVRGLPFSTDEFFAAIRSCYNRRSAEPVFERLTFCLLGVVTPSDLIRDTRLTPFNIGRRIELTDFTPAEATPLAAGLAGTAQDGSVLLRRILDWTGGHPYLTQRLCQAVAAQGAGNPKSPITDPGSAVDWLCQELFLTRRAQERDDNLLFVKERLLRHEGEVAGLLDLYGQIRWGRRAPDDELDPFVSILHLAGIVRRENGRLRVRNRIYARIFDRQWVARHMPGAELRRQREAFRHGVRRTAAAAAVVLATIGGLAVVAANQARRADRERRFAVRQQRIAEAERQQARCNLYAARMHLAQQAEQQGDLVRAQRLLETLRPEAGQSDLRGWEWRYLWQRSEGDARAAWGGQTSYIGQLAFSPDGRILACAGGDAIRLRDPVTGRVIGELRGHRDDVVAVAFSPSGQLLASGGDDGLLRLWNVATRRLLVVVNRTQKERLTRIHAVAFAPNGRLIASAAFEAGVKVWDVNSRRQVAAVPDRTIWHALAFSPDGSLLAVGTDKGIDVRSTSSWQRLALLSPPGGVTDGLAFSPDGANLAAAVSDHSVRVWDLAKRREVAVLWGHTAAVDSVAFAPDGKILASGSPDNTVRLWNVATRQRVAVLHGLRAISDTLAFSPDGKTIASGGPDREVRLFDVPPLAGTALLRFAGRPMGLTHWPGGFAVATQSDGAVHLWDVGSGRSLAILAGSQRTRQPAVFAPGGELLAARGSDRTIRLWELDHRPPASPEPAQPRAGHGAAWAAAGSFREPHGGVVAMAFSPDGKLLAMQTPSAVLLWDRASRRSVGSVRWPGETPGISFSPDGRTLAAARETGAVALWEVPSLRLAATLDNAAFWPPLVFSPDGKLLAGRCFSGVTLYDLARRRPRMTLAQPIDAGQDLPDQDYRFSSDGKTLVVWGNKDVTLWNLATQQEVLSLGGHTGPIFAATFAPDGNSLATASRDGTARLWRAATVQQTDALRLVGSSVSDRRVSVQWRPIPWAMGYDVYRRSGMHTASAEPGGAWTPLTPQPVTGTAFTDNGPGLINGQPQTYAVAPVYRETGGRLGEAPWATLLATPLATPAGWFGSSINEGVRSGSVAMDPRTGEIILRGSGADIMFLEDGFYFLNRPITGDFRVTVTVLTRPTQTHEWAQAGLMVREMLEAGSRHASEVINAAHGLHFKWRRARHEDSDELNWNFPLKLPMLLRLTRHGDTVTAEYSMDGGHQFRTAGLPFTFAPPLPPTVYAGLAISARNPGHISEARFRDLCVEPLQ